MDNVVICADYGTMRAEPWSSVIAGRGASVRGGNNCLVAAERKSAIVCDDASFAIAKQYSRVEVGAYGVAVAGNNSHAKALYNGVALTVNGKGVADAGDGGTAISLGNGGVAESVKHGLALSQCNGSAVVGPEGIAIALGAHGVARGGAGSILVVGYLDANGAQRVAVGYVGDGGLKPETNYTVNQSGVFVEKES